MGRKKKILLLPTLNFRVLTGFRNFCGSGTIPQFNLVAPHFYPRNRNPWQDFYKRHYSKRSNELAGASNPPRRGGRAGVSSGIFPVEVFGQLSFGAGHLAFLLSSDLLLLILLGSRTRSWGGLRRHGSFLYRVDSFQAKPTLTNHNSRVLKNKGSKRNSRVSKNQGAELWCVS